MYVFNCSTVSLSRTHWVAGPLRFWWTLTNNALFFFNQTVNILTWRSVGTQFWRKSLVVSHRTAVVLLFWSSWLLPPALLPKSSSLLLQSSHMEEEKTAAQAPALIFEPGSVLQSAFSICHRQTWRHSASSAPPLPQLLRLNWFRVLHLRILVTSAGDEAAVQKRLPALYDFMLSLAFSSVALSLVIHLSFLQAAALLFLLR